MSMGFFVLSAFRLRPSLAAVKSAIYAQLEQMTDLHELAKALRNQTIIRTIQKGAATIPEGPNIACVVYTFQDVRGATTENTWGRRCDRLLFLKSEGASNKRAVGFKTPTKLKLLGEIFRYAHQRLEDKDRWIIYATATSYFILENLRYLVQDIDSRNAYYMGHMNVTSKGLRLGDDSVFVLSRGALDRIVRGECMDKETTLMHCLRAAQVQLIDSRDPHGCQRFFAEDLPTANLSAYGLNCLSDTPIAFIKPGITAFALLEAVGRYIYPYGIRGYLNTAEAHDNSTCSV
ncbi:glycoprotein-N-acetylgalactosamine 3-beta-galactosyltransferase 1-like [Ornithodoros turicata]|uniref:glycoprotein-N-acetylgalactosamine 3-beta-galactosyltransferase 1-like n=1 Tax=Ornithodoros turicata TaxID=34597 RepID=UPI0031393EE5